MDTFLSQLIPAPSNQGLEMSAIRIIKKYIANCGGMSGRIVEVIVTSANALKIVASVTAVSLWLKDLFGDREDWKIIGKGYDVSSEIDEQPHGEEMTKIGTMNRLKNLKLELAKQNITEMDADGTLRILVSLENGLIEKEIIDVRNSNIFLCDGKVWVDLCFSVCEIWFQGNLWSTSAISEGVLTPIYEVELSKKTNWSQTAGSFIAKNYGWNAKDWHGSISGKGRQTIMTETVKNSFGLYTEVKLPEITLQFKPDTHHQYDSEPIDFFVPTDIKKMLIEEKQDKNQQQIWREIYEQIPQLNKLGADGISSQNSNGIILTEDVLVGYFDNFDGQDILHIVLLLAKSDDEIIFQSKMQIMPSSKRK